MKNLLITLALMLASSIAFANHCTVTLRSGNGTILHSYVGSGYYACEDARRQCQTEIDYRHISYAYCQIDNNSGGYNGGGNSGGYNGGGYGSYSNCYADMTDYYGRVMRTFIGRGYNRGDACRDALRDCNYMRNSSGYYRTQCQIRGGMGGYNGGGHHGGGHHGGGHHGGGHRGGRP